MNIFENLENLEVSEACFNDIIGLIEEFLSENAVDNYYKKKLANIEDQRVIENAKRRKLNRTIDQKANNEFQKAGEKWQIRR